MGLYEELLEREKRRQQFIDNRFNATHSDVVKSLLTSENIRLYGERTSAII